MIGEICGKISKIYNDNIIINVNGIGYIIFLSSKIIEQMAIGDEISILVETRFKVDKICLFGFINEFQHQCFQHISNISGVSDKIATEISGIFSPSDFLSIIDGKSKKNTIKINGVGPKTWEKISFSLERNKNFYNDCVQYQSNSDNYSDKNVNFDNHELYHDGIQGLISIGINKNLAKSLIKKSLNDMRNNSLEIDLQSLIKESLKNYQGNFVSSSN